VACRVYIAGRSVDTRVDGCGSPAAEAPCGKTSRTRWPVVAGARPGVSWGVGPWYGHGAQDHFTRISRRAGIIDATPHTLRHMTGTFLLAAGVPDRTVQAILGHGLAAMTDHYQHVDDGD
jgi:integrase